MTSYKTFIRRLGWIAAATMLAAPGALAQQGAQQGPPQGLVWETMPRMQLEQQYAGPMKDTVIQRWRDPQTGAVCYMYVPFAAQHSPPVATGYVQYGANVIGTISCLEPAPNNVRAAEKRAEHPPARTEPAAPRPAPKHSPE